MTKIAIALLFILGVAVETQSWSVTALSIFVSIYIAVQDKINRELLDTTKDMLELNHAITENQKAAVATQRAYANHVSDLRQMVLSMQNSKQNIPTVKQRPNWVSENDYQG